MRRIVHAAYLGEKLGAISALEKPSVAECNQACGDRSSVGRAVLRAESRRRPHAKDNVRLPREWSPCRDPRSTNPLISSRRTLMGRAILVRFSLCFDDVGIGTCIAVKGPDTVVIECVRSQTSHGLTGSDDNQIVIYVTDKSTARGYV